MPVLEAMGMGTPVLASDIPVHREIAGTAAVLLPSHDPTRWATELPRSHPTTIVVANSPHADGAAQVSFRGGERLRPPQRRGPQRQGSGPPSGSHD